MGSSVKENLRNALGMMFKPLVKLLISQGVSHGDFCEVAKEVYVEVAIRHFDNGKRINQSRAAILTGLTRKEVKNVIDRALATKVEERFFSRPGRVLAGWHSDPNYVGPYGMPLELPYEVKGESGPSFCHLVKTYSGDMAPRQMLEELTRIGAVIELDNNLYKVIRRDYEPEALSPDLVARLGDVAHNFFSTAAKNIEKRGQSTGYFDRMVFTERGITQHSLQMFDEYIKVRGQEFLEELDNWFVAEEKDTSKTAERISTGLYMVHFVEKLEEKTTLSELLRERGLK